LRCGVYIPNHLVFGSPRALVDVAQRVEAAEWDGFFMWDTLTAGGAPVADPQVTLAATAVSTTRIKLGALVTPLARRRPWKVAREIAALAEVSDGRFIMGCSVGSGHDFAPFPGEVRTAAERVARFTDAVELIRLMLSGSPVDWTQSERMARVLGEQPASISVDPFLPAPAEPVPFWGGASVQREREQNVAPFRRAAEMLDGLFPVASPWDGTLPITVEEFARAIDYAFDGAQPPEGFDLVACGSSRGTRGSNPRRFAAEGATWWLEVLSAQAAPSEVHALIAGGPPRP
jgi:alkanesulfonate monooxygenase SsuD/methylene tetrahydromethanopterin reductase-like flavin-dependent oxidoreductase (luciferase family)